MKKALIYILLGIILAVFIFRTDYDFSIILRADAVTVIFLVLVLCGSYVNNYFAMDIHFRMLNANESRKNKAMLSMAINLLNYLPGKGGVISLGTFLKVKKKVPVNRFVFITMLGYIIVTLETVIISLFFILDEKMLSLYRKIDVLYLSVFFLLCLILLVISVYLARKNRDNVVSKYYLLFLKNRHIIRTNKVNVLYYFFIILAGITLFSLRMYFSFQIAGQEISLYHALMIGVITNLSFFLSFTPGGLGVKEGFVGGISYLLFGSAELGIIAALADRAVNLILTIITGSYAIKHLDRIYFSNNGAEE